MKALVENYRFTNLAELRDTIEHITLTASIAARRKVHPEEIALETENWTSLDGCLMEETLTDGSKVYNIELSELPVSAPSYNRRVR